MFVLTWLQEQVIAIDEENAGLRTERAELHSLLNDTAQELEQTKKELAETAGGSPSLLRRFQMVLPVHSEMLEATASELESSKAEACIKTSDLQALSSALSHAEEQHAAAAAAAAASHAASSETIGMLEVQISSPRFSFSQRCDTCCSGAIVRRVFAI